MKHMYEHMKEIVGNAAVVTTIIQFLSGTIICKDYVINRTTADTSPLQFIMGIISSALWFLYGAVKHDKKIIIVNIVGIVLMIAYTVVFYIYTFKRASLVKQFFVSMLSLLAIMGYIAALSDDELLLNHIGFSASVFTLLTIAAPLVKLVHVLKVKSTECLPFPMIFMSFIVSTLWFLYGEIEEDMYLATVNFVGAALALSQLSLFIIFPRTSKITISKGIIA